jgi:integrase/recombinase XerC
MTVDESYLSLRTSLAGHTPPDELAQFDDLISKLMAPTKPYSSITHLLHEHGEYMRRRRKTEGSIYSRSHRLQALIDWASPRSILELRREDIEQYLVSCRVALGTKRGYLSHIHSFFEWAVIEGYTQRDPTLAIELDKPRLLSFRPISTEDFNQAIENAEQRVRAILLLAYEGLKPSEIALLRGSDVDTAKRQLHVPGRNDRIIPLRESVAHDLPDRKGYLFSLRNGRRASAHNISHEGNRFLHGIDVRETLTSIRHRRGFDDYLARRDLQLTQQLMGHASAASTAGYATADAKKVAGIQAEAS